MSAYGRNVQTSVRADGVIFNSTKILLETFFM